MNRDRITARTTRSPATNELIALVCIALVVAVPPAIVPTHARPTDLQEEIGLSGYVLTPGGLPVSDGTVTLQGPGAEVTAPIDSTGRFRIAPDAFGFLQMHVNVPGFMMQRLKVAVPLSKTFTLPPIHLSPPPYFRVRLLSPGGEPLTVPRVLRQSLDVNGAPIWEPPGGRNPDQFDPDGRTTIGPLPRGVTTFIVDAPPFARTRLPDVRITGESTLIDGGMVTLEPGGTLSVELVDAAGDPVPGRDVYLEEMALFSPIVFPPQKSDQKGQVSFDRLASGRYRLRTTSVGPCGGRLLAIVRSLRASGKGTVHTRVVVGGTLTLRLASSGVPVRAAQISVTPEAPAPTPPPWLRGSSGAPLFAGRPFGSFHRESPCTGATDSGGRVTMNNFPPGPARVDVRLPNSTWIRRFIVPSQRRDVELEIPAGFLPVRVVNAQTRAPVQAAAITWTSDGTRVEATASVTGDALLDGVANASGTLTVRWPGYRPAELKLRTPPDVLYEVPLEPTREESLSCRVVSESGEPLAHAVVEVRPNDPLDVDQVATTDAKGFVRFFVPPGSVRLVARADGHVASMRVLSSHAASNVTLTLSRGYRVVARVESPLGRATHRIRILNRTGVAMDDILDAASDRIIEPPGRVSLGPLPPGTYVVDLRGPREHRQQIRIEKRDVHVTFR